MYHLHIPLLNVTKMQNELQKVSNEGSQFSDIFEKIQADKAQLSTESKRLNSDTHNALNKLSVRFIPYIFLTIIIQSQEMPL